MKILLYGEYWPGTHVDCISCVLKEKKINFKIFDFYKYINPKYINLYLDKVINKLSYIYNENLINKKLLLEIEHYKPDILLISKGINIYPDTLIKFKQKGIIIANWNPDDFFNILNSSKNLLDSLNLYDFVFSARKHLFDEYQNKGIKNPHYIEWYYIPWLHKKYTNIQKVENKVTFIGTFSKRRESILASINSEIPIDIWGGGWTFSTIRKNNNINVKNKILSQSEFPKIISESLINLNILTSENRDQTNLKIFEITASNGLLLTEETEISKSILGSSAFFYDPNNLPTLNDNINNIISYKENITNLCEKGYKNITSNQHSIHDRVEQILNYF
jgi:spore maturation protein CgeB